MSKEFNTTGLCLPDVHYMADISGKLAACADMVERGRYFVINRPRQYGKTTMLHTLAEHLQALGGYVVLNTSFEGVGDAIFKDEVVFSRFFIQLIAKYADDQIPDIKIWADEKSLQITNFSQLEAALTEMLLLTSKKVVLMVDEVDKSSNNQLFVNFLGLLRNKYLERTQFKTFHAVVLAGVHDVKSLKLKIRPDASEDGNETAYNSPWNIATDFKVDMNLTAEEIEPMLRDYASTKAFEMDTKAMADRLFYYTSGYPFLVSKICQLLDEEVAPRQPWSFELMEKAVAKLVKENNTNFEALTKNLAANKALYDWVQHIAVDGHRASFSLLNPTTQLGVQYGILTEKEGLIAIHNRIYSEVVLEFMRERLYQMTLAQKHESHTTSGYKTADNLLNMEAVLLGFQAFMKKEYSKKDRDFLERNGRLVFLAFLKPIINGSGYDFKEPQVSDERRLDVAITYLNQKFVAEMKIWHGPKAHEQGLIQLADYLQRQALDQGYLIIFDHSETKQWHSEWATCMGKNIFIVWV